MNCTRNQAPKNRRAMLAVGPLGQLVASDGDDEEDFEHCALVNRLGFKLFMAELLATFVFVYLGQAALTSFELMGTQNDMLTRQLATILSFGLANLFASALVLNISGAYLNPAYTLASAAFGRLAWRRAISFCCAQYLGALMAAIFLHSTYLDKLQQRHLEGLLLGANATLRAHGSVLSTGKLFTSYPPTEVSLSQLFVSYALATAHFALLLATIHDSRLLRLPRSLRPFYLAAALCLVLAAFAANGGPVLNPAQDVAPRLYIALAGWGAPAFNLYNFRYWWLCCIVAPHLGALLGLALYKLLDHLKGPQRPAHLVACEQHSSHHRDHHHNHEYTLSRDNDF